MNEETVICTQGLTKFYGKKRGVVSLDLQVQRGEVFGYLGPNGAGKTTTIRLLLDFIRPTRGRITVFGLDSRQRSLQIHSRLGYLPGELSLYQNLTGREFLLYASHLRGVVDLAYVQELADRLGADLSQPIHSLSHGNRQKVGLINSLMCKPELIVLDEPTLGLDPLMQQEFYRLIAETKADGRTVFLSSHNLPEVERICDRVCIIREGRIVTVERVDELKGRALRQLEINFATPVPQEAFSKLPGVSGVKMEVSVLHCTVTGSLDSVIKAAAQFEVINIFSREPSLEDVFLAYYGGGDERAQ